MKKSRYNIFIDLPKSGITLAFNGMTTGLAELSFEDSKVAQKILSDPDGFDCRLDEERDIRDMLIEGGFLIEDDVDELDILKRANRLSRFNSNSLGLTIAPTTACNFKCSYCYENHDEEEMSHEVQDAVVKMVAKRIKNKRNLSVTWFGGEPMLALDVMENLTSRFRVLSQKFGFKYCASIVSNGYLLNRKNAERLKNLGIRDVQITLDGPPEIHNKRRPLLNGKGTFNRIVKNLKEIYDLLEVTIRVNVDKSNLNETMKLLDCLEQEGLKRKLMVYFGHVWGYTEVCADITTSCFDREEFGKIEAHLQWILYKRGFIGGKYPSVKRGFCTADSASGMVISPKGKVFKCWNDFGCKEDEVVVYDLLNGSNVKMQENMSRWMNWDPFSKKDCVQCSLLPICMGGCPYLGLKLGDENRGECVRWKYNLKEFLALYFYKVKMKRLYEQCASKKITSSSKASMSGMGHCKT